MDDLADRVPTREEAAAIFVSLTEDEKQAIRLLYASRLKDRATFTRAVRLDEIGLMKFLGQAHGVKVYGRTPRGAAVYDFAYGPAEDFPRRSVSTLNLQPPKTKPDRWFDSEGDPTPEALGVAIAVSIAGRPHENRVIDMMQRLAVDESRIVRALVFSPLITIDAPDQKPLKPSDVTILSRITFAR